MPLGAHPGVARGVRPHRAPDDALRRGSRAVRSRGRVGPRTARRPRDAGRAEAGGRCPIARGGVPRAHGPSSGRDGRRVSARAVYGIVAREFVRFLRQRGRVLASIGRPFVWLVFAGAGFAAVFAGRNQIDYRVYMAPGLLGMVVMFGSLLAALSTVTDREAGVLRMVLVAPIRRSTIAFGKTLGATLLGTAQALVVAGLLLPVVHLRPTLAGALLGLVAVVLSGLAMGALGLVLAASIRSIENFAGVMNFVIFPMLFLSGALYPVRHLGLVLRAVAYANPLAYGVDLLKHALLGAWAEAGYGGELPVPLDCGALVLFAIVGLALAASLLGREGGVTRTALRGRS
ncbi:MAG: ABC transporter [Gemmatimonadetes bacterium]|nr:MAG: ABC transporter [Gemmatimonadota bacterium]